MKCQHCGIHFDDEERVCPMCGARAGSKGRMTTRTEMARQAARDLHRISSDDREQQLGENGEEQVASHQG
ncbi:MAG: hypothetical protein ACLT4C_03515 [Butyricicoccus sp.]